MDEGAITPNQDITIKIYGELKQEQEKTFDSLKEKEEVWQRFADSEFYFMVKDYTEHLVAALENLEDQAWETGAKAEEFVIRRAVMKLTKANLLSIIKKADGSRLKGGDNKKSSVS